MLLARAVGESVDHRLLRNLADAHECVAVRPSFSTGHFSAGQPLEGLGRYAAAREAYNDGTLLCWQQRRENW